MNDSATVSYGPRDSEARSLIQRWTWAVITALAVILSSLAGAVLHTVNQQVVLTAAIVESHSARIAVIESTDVSTEKRLARIEDKIDKLLEHSNGRKP